MTSRPWFGPRRFGWGWTPVTWKGWALTMVFLAGILAAGLLLTSTMRVAVIVVLLVILILLCYLTGGPPGSTWGRRE